MALAHLSILAFGTLLIAVPIALHLMMRQQPKHVVFPAMRFITQRRDANRRRMRIRHWLLLALRCAVIALLAAALAKPSVVAAAFGAWWAVAAVAAAALVAAALTIFAVVGRQRRWVAGGWGAMTLAMLILLIVLLPRALAKTAGQVLGDQRAPVAAVLVFDTSPRMQYVHQNQTRLELAKANGRWLLGQLPAGSEVSVADSRLGPAAFAIDRGAAAREIEGLQVTNVPMPLARVLETAIRLARQSNQSRKEIYVFSDLTAAAWDPSTAGRLRATIGQSENELLYVWDVGVPSPRNDWLGLPRLSAETLARNSTLQVRIELLRRGPGGQGTVQLQLERPSDELPVIVDGKPVLPEALPRGRQSVKLARDGSQWLDFSLRGLDLGTHHGQVRIVGQDALACDDIRHFTIQVTRPWRVLMAAGKGARATFVADALAPTELRDTDRARFQCDMIDTGQLATANLSDFAAVGLLDPGPLPDATWRKLASYVRQGGGLGIFLGRNVTRRDDFCTPAALELLPGKLDRIWRSADDRLLLAPSNLEHPILAWLRQDPSAVVWDQSPIYRHWSFREPTPDSSVILRFGNGQPALLERQAGQGRLLVMTTPLSDPLHEPGRPAWNLLLTGLDPWPSVVLCNELFLYLVKSGETKLNYLVGQTARLALPTSRPAGHLQLFTPRGDWRNLTVEGGQLRYPFTELPGTYRIKGDMPREVAAGFSVNLPAEASRLDRVDTEQLDLILGPNRYRLARNRAEIDRGVGEARVGRQFYPYLLVLLALVLGLEHLLANRFYRRESAEGGSVLYRWPLRRAEATRAKSA